MGRKSSAALAQALILLALLTFAVARPRWRAQRLLRALADVEVGRSDALQVRRLAGDFGADAVCAEHICAFHFTNTWLRRLHLAPPAQFSVLLVSAAPENGGRLSAIDTAMLVESGDAPLSALVFDRLASAAPLQPDNVTFDQGRAVRTVVELAPSSGSQQRQRARAFNLACLTRLGGCRSSLELLPGVQASPR